MVIAYNIIGIALSLFLSPLFALYILITGRYHQSIPQRLGLYPRRLLSNLSGSPRVWFHAASVGEVRAAITIIEALLARMPECALILSSVTEQGYALAKTSMGSKAMCIYAPIDWYISVYKAFSMLKPDVLVCIETELWPNMLMEAHRKGVKIALVNGRVSDRSIKGYVRIRPLMRAVLKYIDTFSMIRDTDAQRICLLGAPQNRVAVNGNAKYDIAGEHADTEIKTKLMKLYNLKGNESVFVAGSTRGSEQGIVLDVFERIVQSFPDMLLIIAPRHVNRSQYIQTLVKKRGLPCQLRTDLDRKNAQRSAPIVILDTIGELKATYSIATIVFCGGSLVPLGGQNIFEPAAWGKPVFYGPSMEDFGDAKELLEKTGGGIQVANGHQLAEQALYFLANPAHAEEIGMRAQQAVMLNKGAARKHAEVVCRLFRGPCTN